MFFLLSGEGPTDLGAAANANRFCRGEDFLPGPMALLINLLVESRYQYSPFESAMLGFVPKPELVQRADELKAARKPARLPGKKQAKETRYYYNNARVFARIATEKASELGDVIAVLFRDADGSASSDRGEWEAKFQSMLDGFAEERYSRGVPMVAKPKSEAWILCALKCNYQNCDSLEDRSGNDDSPNSLKDELRAHLNEDVTRELLNDLVTSNKINPALLQMPSFVRFRDRFHEVIGN